MANACDILVVDLRQVRGHAKAAGLRRDRGRRGRPGNRPATSRKYSVHPGTLAACMGSVTAASAVRPSRPPARGGHLPEERAVLALLRDRAALARGLRRLAA